MNIYLAAVIGGIVGSAIFGVMLTKKEKLPMIAGLVGSRSNSVGWIVHLIAGVIMGLLYVWLLMWFGLVSQGIEPAMSILYGAIYGVAWWLVGPSFIMPLRLGKPVELAAMPILLGHIVFGVALASTIALLM